MRILLDHCMPRGLRRALAEHEVETADHRGWSDVSNGALLAAAEDTGFDLLLTADQGLRYQQNLSSRRIAVIVLSRNSWKRIRLSLDRITAAIDSMRPGEFVEVEIP